MTNTEIKYKLKRRWKILLLIILIIISISLWARFVSTSGLHVKEYKVIDSKLPQSFYGLKVVHFSDLHYGRTIHKKELISLVEKINLVKPDVVIFTGDLIDKDIEVTSSMENIIKAEFKKINSTYGNYYVSGNHDKSFKGFDSLMKNSNFISLNNNYDIIYSSNYDSIFVGGINSYISKKGNISNIEEYLKTSDTKDYKLFAMHVPDNMKYIEELNFNLVIAGHSHNGQVRIPYVGAVIKPVGAKKYYKEYYKINDTNLYISSGIGTSTLNIRFFNKPSFNLYRIVNK